MGPLSLALSFGELLSQRGALSADRVKLILRGQGLRGGRGGRGRGTAWSGSVFPVGGRGHAVVGGTRGLSRLLPGEFLGELLDLRLPLADDLDALGDGNVQAVQSRTALGDAVNPNLSCRCGA